MLLLCHAPFISQQNRDLGYLGDQSWFLLIDSMLHSKFRLASHPKGEHLPGRRSLSSFRLFNFDRGPVGLWDVATTSVSARDKSKIACPKADEEFKLPLSRSIETAKVTKMPPQKTHSPCGVAASQACSGEVSCRTQNNKNRGLL
jgi:hypothetical protein